MCSLENLISEIAETAPVFGNTHTAIGTHTNQPTKKRAKKNENENMKHRNKTFHLRQLLSRKIQRLDFICSKLRRGPCKTNFPIESTHTRAETKNPSEWAFDVYYMQLSTACLFPKLYLPHLFRVSQREHAREREKNAKLNTNTTFFSSLSPHICRSTHTIWLLFAAVFLFYLRESHHPQPLAGCHKNVDD